MKKAEIRKNPSGLGITPADFVANRRWSPTHDGFFLSLVRGKLCG
jgi:hypothetical protein